MSSLFSRGIDHDAGALHGMKVIYSPHALEETEERLFPENRYRSRRLHKKLVKRFGGEFKKRPCIWKMGNTLFVHPAHKAEFDNLRPQ